MALLHLNLRNRAERSLSMLFPTTSQPCPSQEVQILTLCLDFVNNIINPRSIIPTTSPGVCSWLGHSRKRWKSHRN